MSGRLSGGRWSSGGVILGRGGSAFGVASHAVSGVTRPGRPWWGRWVLLDVVEGVDLGLELVEAGGQWLGVEPAEQGWWKRSFLPWVVGL